MGTTAGQRLGRVLGYGLYGAGVLALLLWVLFPRDAVRRFLEEKLGRVWPDLHWRVDGVALEMPADLTFRAIEGYAGKNEALPLVRMERLSIRPDLPASVLSRSAQAGYRLRVGGGTVTGVARWGGGHDGGRIDGTIRDVSLADLPWLSRELGRAVRGSVSGSFTAIVPAAPSGGMSLEARLGVADGRLELQRPILGHPELPFARVTARVRGQGQRFELSEGTIASDLFDGRFSGTATLHSGPEPGQIDVHGTVEPTDKFFKGLDNTVHLQALRLQLKDKALPFGITGELASPGIRYGEFAMLVQTLEKELE